MTLASWRAIALAKRAGRNIVRQLSIGCVLLLLLADLAHAGDHRFQVLLDTDNNPATGCTVATSKGPVAGVEQVWTTVVTTTASNVVVKQVEHQTCVGGALSASVVYATAGWPVNLGIGISGTGPIETYVPLSFLPTSGTMKVFVASTNATGGQDTAGPFLIALGAPGGGQGAAAPIPLSPWVALSASLLIAGLALRWRPVDSRRAALVVLWVAIACTGVVFAGKVILDGNIGDWAGVPQVAGNPKGSAPIDANIVGVFYQSDAMNLYFRIDADLALDTTSAAGPQIAPIADSTIVLGSRFQQLVQATAANANLTLTFALPVAPGGATLNPAPLIDWTPSFVQLGVNPFTVMVTDNLGKTATASFHVTVTQVDLPPQLAPQADATVRIGTTFARTLTATSPNAGDTLTFALVSGPTGMVLNGANLSWPTVGVAIGDYPVTVKVTNSGGLSDSKSFTLTVLPLVAPVAIDDHYSVNLGQTLNVVAPGVLGNDLDADGASLTATGISIPDKGTLNAFNSDGSFKYTAPAVAAGPVFQPVLKWGTAFPNDGVTAGLSNPRVADAFGNGKPVIFVAHEPGNSTGIAAIDGATGATIWWVYGALPAPYAGCHIGTDNIWEQIAVGDVDDSGAPAVVTPAWCDADSNVGTFVSRMIALDARTGAVKWLSPPLGAYIFTAYNGAFYHYPITYSVMPAIARLHPGETPSVLFKNVESGYLNGDPTLALACTQFQATSTLNDCTGVLALNGADGTIRQGFVAPNDGQADGGTYNPGALAIADLTGSGKLNVMANGAVWDADGNLLSNRLGTTFASLAVAKLDDSGQASIISYEYGGNLGNLSAIVARHADGSVQWQSPLNFCDGSGCGQLSVADIDGDGLPEILATSFQKLWVYDVHGQIKWVRDYGTYPGNSGQPLFFRFKRPAAFDLDGSGIAEVIIPTELGLDFADGATGMSKANLLWSDVLAQPGLAVCGSYQGGFGASAIVADIDGSGHASVVVSFPGDQYPQSHCVFAFTAQNNDWRPAPTVFNEFGYHVSNVDNTGKIPSVEANNFATPRTNVYGNQPQLLTPVDPAVNTTTKFQYTASAEGLTSAPATVTITLVPNHPPPVFTSIPPTQYVPGPFTYAAHAFDPEPGDTITYSIVLTGGNTAYTCSIDPVSGVLTCPNLSSGNQFIVLAATDIHGLVANQVISLTQSAGPATVPNVVGASQTAAEATLVNAGFVTGNVSSIYFAAPVNQVLTQFPGAGTTALLGSAVALQVSLGLQPQPVPNLVGLTLTEARALLVGLGFTVIVDPVSSPTAPADEVTGQNPAFGTTLAPPSAVTLTVSTGPPLSGTVAQVIVRPAAPQLRVVGDTLAYTATAIFTDNTSADVTLAATWNSSVPTVASVDGTGNVIALKAGGTTISAMISGVTGQSTLNVVARTGANSVNPLAQITAPVDGTRLSTITTVTGTASDTNFLRYELAVAPAGTTSWTVIGAGTTAVTAGALGTLDPTTLINGAYTLQLTAFDTNGNQTVVTAAVQVIGAQKPGLFTLTYQDLYLPVAGIPLTVTRTYDSRDKGQGDFGIGWRLGFKTLRISESAVMGAGWQSIYQSLNYALVPGNSHFVSITLPDGEVENFDLALTPNTSVIVPITTLQASYVPESGTIGTLTSLDNTNLIIADSQPGPITLLDDTTLNTFDPVHYQYTTVNGTKINLDRNLGVTQVTDRNGNSVTYGFGGIISSTGKSVVFARDSQGRITQITDPVGNVQTYGYNGNGDLVSHTTATGLRSHYAYDYLHDLIDTQDPAGNHPARNGYDASGHLISTTDANGNTITFANNQAASTQVITDQLGNPTIYAYDAMGNITSKTDALGHVWNYTYDSRNNQLTQADPLGRVATKTYDSNNNVLTSTDFDGNTTTSTYNAFAQVLIHIDPEGRITTNVYDGSGNLTQVTDPEGGVTSHTYGGIGNVLTTKDALGNLTTFAYDGAGEQTSKTDPLGNTTTYTYDNNGHNLSETAANGKTATFVYDANGQQIGTTDRLGNTTTFVYSNVGLGNSVSSVTDPTGKVTGMAYDAAGNLTQTTYPDGSSAAISYDADNRQSTTTNRDGRTTLFEYDALGRLTKTTLPDGTTAPMTYDVAGRVLTQTDERGNTTTTAYAPNQQTITDALGNMVVNEFDSQQRLVQTTNALAHVTRFTYDSAGNVTQTTYPDGTFKRITYDAARRRIAETDQAGVTTQFAYDAPGNLIRVTDALGGITSYTYDAVGNRLTQTDANGRTTQISYDAMGRVVNRTKPSGTHESFVFDAIGNQVSHTDFNGQTSTFNYDTQGLLTQEQLPDGTTVAYAYTAAGLRTQAGGDSYVYDAEGRLTQEHKASGQTLTYGYDAAGNRTSLTTPQGTTTYTYDALNRLSTVVDTTGTTTYAYDAAGRLISTAYPNAVTTTNHYDTLNRLTDVTNTGPGGLISSYSYTLGPTGNRTQVVEAGSATTGRSVAYSYDALYRLTQERITEPGPVITTTTYSLDAVGNRTQMIRGGATTTYTYDANDQLISRTSGGNTVTSTFDNNGNLVGDSSGAGIESYTYDAENRLVSASVPAGSFNYTYDADGVRVGRTTGGVTTGYLVDKNRDFAQVLAETTGANILQYTYGNRLINQQSGAGAHFYIADGQQSTRQLTIAAGVVSDSYTYDAFGVPLTSSGATANAYRYGGEQQEPVTGYYYLRARYDDPATGRFLTTDTELGNPFTPMSMHPYLYGDANPVDNLDPSGRFDLTDITFTNSLYASLATGLAVTVGTRATGIARDWQTALLYGAAATTVVGIGGFAAASYSAVAVETAQLAASQRLLYAFLQLVRVGRLDAAKAVLRGAAARGFAFAGAARCYFFGAVELLIPPIVSAGQTLGPYAGLNPYYFKQTDFRLQEQAIQAVKSVALEFGCIQ